MQINFKTNVVKYRRLIGMNIGMVTLAACNSSDQMTSSPATQIVVESTASQAPAYQAGWISVVQKGEGPDVILIPGLASSASVWDGTVAAFNDTHRLHIVQVAGFAGAPKSSEERQNIIDGLAADIAEYVKAEKLKAPVIIGHSLGGFTTLNIARDYPESLSRAIVVDSLPFYSVIFNPAATPENTRPQAEQIVTQMRQAPKATYDAMQAQNARIYTQGSEAQARIIKDGANSDREVVLAAMYELMTTDIRGDLGAIKTPVSVIYAHDNRMGMTAEVMTTLYESQYASLPDVALTRIDKSFHFIMDDQPQVFQSALSAELNK